MPIESEGRTVDEELIERSKEAVMAQFVTLCILLLAVRKTTKLFGQVVGFRDKIRDILHTKQELCQLYWAFRFENPDIMVVEKSMTISQDFLRV
jgi:hypothetical protein